MGEMPTWSWALISQFSELNPLTWPATQVTDDHVNVASLLTSVASQLSDEALRHFGEVSIEMVSPY